MATRYEMVVIGPNTLGFSSFHHGLHAIFWHLDARPGLVAILSQSGGVGLTMGNALQSLHCGLSHFIGVGNRTVLDFEDHVSNTFELSKIQHSAVADSDKMAESAMQALECITHGKSHSSTLRQNRHQTRPGVQVPENGVEPMVEG